MVQSGAKPNQAAIEGFQRVMRRENRWAIFKFDHSKGAKHPSTGKALDPDIVTISDVGSATSNFKDLLEKINTEQCIYIAYNCIYKTDQDQEREKLLLVCWSNDDWHGMTATKAKMMLTSTEKEIVQKFNGFAKKTTINAVDELNEENFVNIVSENKTK